MRPVAIIEVMSTAFATADPKFAVGARVKRLNDGAPGVVRATGLMGNVWVVWDSSDLETVVKARQIEPA